MESHAEIKTALSDRTKYRGVNGFRYSELFTLIGLAISLCFSLLTISWVQHDRPLYTSAGQKWIDPDDIKEIPPIRFPGKPKPRVIELTRNPIDEVDKDLLPVEVDPMEPIEIPIDPGIPSVPEGLLDTFALPKAPPITRMPEDDAIVVFAEQMPRFPGCENLEGTNAEKYACAEKRLLEYIYANVKYPAIARENEIQGNVLVEFIVEKDGRTSNAQIIRDIGGGCGDEVLNVINEMNAMLEKWTPGKQQGRPVRVIFRLPVAFRLK